MWIAGKDENEGCSRAGKVVRLRGSSMVSVNAFSSIKQPLESTQEFTRTQIEIVNRLPWLVSPLSGLSR